MEKGRRPRRGGWTYVRDDRLRDRGMYEMDAPEITEVTDALGDCEQLIQLVAGAVRRARTR